jgi:hypothetical protein
MPKSLKIAFDVLLIVVPLAIVIYFLAGCLQRLPGLDDANALIQAFSAVCAA